MKNYLVKATRNFTDMLENEYRKENDEFLCSKERYEEFVKHNNAVKLVKIMEDKKEEKIEEKENKPKQVKSQKKMKSSKK